MLLINKYKPVSIKEIFGQDRAIDELKKHIKSKKPVIAIKSGTTSAGQKAALSHTGSLAGEIEIYKAAFKQSNVFLAETVEDAFDKAQFLIYQNLRNKSFKY